MTSTARPFRLAVEQAVLDRIAHRLADSRIGYEPEGGGWQWGMDRDYLEEFVAYWRDQYDWRVHEEAINRWPQFLANVDGVDIHFYHVKGDGSKPLPILLTHGWPGSVYEFHEAMPQIVAAGYDVVVPSLPGFGLSGRPPQPIGPRRVAGLWYQLMTKVLGYPRFYAQGGDFGSGVTQQMAICHTEAVAAVHQNFFMGPPPGSADDRELADYWRSVEALMREESGYHHEHATKPQTIGLALHDNPVGWAAWVVEKFWRWGDTHGDVESRFSKDQLITNLMLYLVTGNVMSSVWMYYGSKNEKMAPGPVTVPAALTHYPAELYPMPSRRLAEMAYTDLRQWTKMESGGHFAAMEEPEAFSADVIRFFDSLS